MLINFLYFLIAHVLWLVNLPVCWIKVTYWWWGTRPTEMVREMKRRDELIK